MLFRDLDWVTPRAIRLFLGFLLVFSLADFTGLALAPLYSKDLEPGQHIAQDYRSFWTSSFLMRQGKPADAYDPGKHQAAQDAQVGHVLKRHEGFFYPPVFLMLCWPMALLPFVWSASVWLASGAGVFAWFVARRNLLAGFAFPMVLLNALYGQNAFFTAALLGGAALSLDRAPFLAGLCLSLFLCKPQLAVLIPVFLFAGRRWGAVAGAAVGGLGLVGLSALVLGPDIWIVWWKHTAYARHVFENGLMGFDKMTSVFAMMRVAGGSVALSYVVQAVSTVAAAAMVIKVAMQRRDTAMEVAVFVACIPLATPFILDYDLVILTLPLLILIERTKTGFLPWEKAGLLLLFLGPLLLKGAASSTLFPFTALEAPLLLALLGQRLAVLSKSASQPPPSAR